MTMRPFPWFSSLFVILISMFVLAQTTPVVNEQNRLPGAQGMHMLQGAPFTQHRAGAFKAIEHRQQTSRTPEELNFAPAVPYNSGGYASLSLAVGDVNGDGKQDAIVANACSVDFNDCYPGSIGVLLGNGDGTFRSAAIYTSGVTSPASVALGDLNGDGYPDLVIANNGNSAVAVLLNNGDGTFQAAVSYGSGGLSPVSVAVADVNLDGKPDVVVANVCGDSYCPADGSVGVLLGNGDGTLQTAVPYDSGGLSADSVGVADVNGDGRPDIIVISSNCEIGSCPPGSVGVLLGNGDGTFQPAVVYGSGGYLPESVAVADLNGDGYPDLVIANNGNSAVAVLLNNGDGTFQPAVTYNSGPCQSVSITDVNGDGKPDLVVANVAAVSGLSGSVSMLLGNGDGTFQSAVSYVSGGYDADSVAVADVNGDGKPDVLVANYCAGLDQYGQCEPPSLMGVLINLSVGSTTTALVSSSNPSAFGQTVTFTATVVSQGFKGTPTGTVSFFDGATNIGNSNLNNAGIATLTTSTLSVGTHNITATYNGDPNFAPSTSPILYQIVQGAIAVLSPNSLNFGNQTVGITSSPQNVTLQNTGNINLTISLIQITGVNASDFAQNNNCPASLAPNNSCQISVTFTPTNTGTRNAAVGITDNAPGSPQAVSLTGVGVLPAITFSPTSLSFATQVVYTTSPAQKVTLTNNGLGILEIKSGKISGQFAIANTTCGKTLASGASCTVNINFKPKTKGPLTGSLSVTDNAPNSPQQVPLSGTGTFVQVQPTGLNFGTQPVHTTSLPKYVTLTNKGNAQVNFTGTGITITGTDPGDFAQVNNCGSSLASGASCKIKVTFTPSQQGKRTANVSISDDGGGSPQMVGLTGTGTP